MTSSLQDTIVAISTPLGESGIGIVRLSGKRAIAIAEGLVNFPKKGKSGNKSGRTVLYGFVVDPRKNVRVDEVLVTTMRAPGTYTREDVVEINCHGGLSAVRETLELVLDSGARLAEPGEFTKRAFLNGRIDLAQAEATADIIRSKTDASLRAATQQLEGKLSQQVEAVREDLLETTSNLEAAVDFSDEDVEVLPYKKLVKLVGRAKRKVDKLLKDADKGRILREGVRAVIVGKPNVGKSSLLNALLKEKRAIVTAMPGTTRDVIEETISIKGVPIRLKDTAGIRSPRDEAEREGVKRSKESVQRADLVIFVVDTSEDLSEEDFEIAREANDKKTLAVLNKIDLPGKISKELTIEKLGIRQVAETSATRETGLEELEQEIIELIFSGEETVLEEVMVTNIRHQQALKRARESISKAEEILIQQLPEEVVATVLKEAMDNLGEIVGKVYTEHLLDRIFSQFCIGK